MLQCFECDVVIASGDDFRYVGLNDVDYPICMVCYGEVV